MRLRALRSVELEAQVASEVFILITKSFSFLLISAFLLLMGRPNYLLCFYLPEEILCPMNASSSVTVNLYD
jgi:hypothetical protein